MLQPTKRGLGEYQTFVLKMHVDKNSSDHAMKIFELLCDLQTI